MAGWKSFSVCCALCGLVAGQANAGFVSPVAETVPAQGMMMTQELPADFNAAKVAQITTTSVMSDAVGSEIARQASLLPQVRLNVVADTSHKAMKLSAEDVALLADIAPTANIAVSSLLASAGMVAFLVGVVGIALKLIPQLLQFPVRRLQQVA